MKTNTPSKKPATGGRTTPVAPVRRKGNGERVMSSDDLRKRLGLRASLTTNLT